jgi:hypothetical protein
VESVRDVMSIENTGQYHGVYHVLGGIISPINGVGPSDITISQLVARVADLVSPEALFEADAPGIDGAPAEVILALSGDVEGETTAFYIYRQISQYGVKVSSLARGLGFGVIYQGIVVAALTMLSYYLGRYAFNGGSEILGTSMAFLTLSMAEVFHSFNMRSLKGSIFTIKKQNLVLWGAGIIAIAATILVLQVPFIAENVFSLQPLNVAQFFTAVGIAFAIIPIVEIVKLIQRLIDKKRK